MSTPNEVVATTVKGANTANLVTVSNVAEIFNAAGFAFKKLGELVQQLDSGPSDNSVTTATPNGNTVASPSGLSHWDTNDVEQFQTIITNFNDELSKLSNNLKNKMSARLFKEHSEIADQEIVKSE